MTVAALNTGTADPRQPGEFRLMQMRSSGKTAGMDFACPCGCGFVGWLPFDSYLSEGWHWDEDPTAPSLTPSVLQRGCGWHGYLTNGEWIQI